MFTARGSRGAIDGETRKKAEELYVTIYGERPSRIVDYSEKVSVDEEEDEGDEDDEDYDEDEDDDTRDEYHDLVDESSEKGPIGERARRKLGLNPTAVDAMGTPLEYDGFENLWQFDEEPVFDPLEAIERETASNPPKNDKQIGWDDQFRLAYLAANASKPEIIEAFRSYAQDLEQYVHGKEKESWPRLFTQTADWLERGTGKPYWSTFQQGNTKLPFWEWSVVAAGTCPGAGACLNFCYSIKFWFRYFVFRRQIMNTLLLRFHPDVVEREFLALKFGPANPYMRLHVHGDFADIDAVRFWMNTIAMRPDVKVYAYSKSWELLLQYDEESGGDWPENFALNLSSGSIYGSDVKERMAKLACSRGEFVALDLTKAERKTVHDMEALLLSQHSMFRGVSPSRLKITPEQTAELGKIRMRALNQVIASRKLRERGEKWFPCPGFCATCVGSAGDYHHACGQLDKMAGTKIAIGIH